MKLSQDLSWRGLIKDKTFEDAKWLDTPRTFYLGADGSADSLTIGNLAIFITALRLRDAGWKTVLLVGGATSLIGDPGGKDAERDLKSQEEIEANIAGIRAQVERLFSGQTFELVNNYDWFKGIGYIDFLREIGKHFSMTELLQRDFIAARIGDGGSGISYTEFSYSLIQGYDYWHLYNTHGVELQIGGSDQWGNMLSGAPLIRKLMAREENGGEEVTVHAMSMPLVINKQTGKKFGKSESGAVWLDPAKTSVTQFYQFWVNCDDEGVEDYIKVYTFMNQEEVAELMADHVKSPQKRIAQRRLAHEVTQLVHGEDAAWNAELVTDLLTGATPIGEAEKASVDILRSEQPSCQVQADSSVVEALTASGLVASSSEARRLLKDNAISINGQKIGREKFEASDFNAGRLLLRRGKKFRDTALVELAGE